MINPPLVITGGPCPCRWCRGRLCSWPSFILINRGQWCSSSTSLADKAAMVHTRSLKADYQCSYFNMGYFGTLVFCWRLHVRTTTVNPRSLLQRETLVHLLYRTFGSTYSLGRSALCRSSTVITGFGVWIANSQSTAHWQHHSCLVPRTLIWSSPIRHSNQLYHTSSLQVPTISMDKIHFWFKWPPVNLKKADP